MFKILKRSAIGVILLAMYSTTLFAVYTKELKPIPSRSGVYDIAISSDGSYIIPAPSLGIKVWDLKTGEFVKTIDSKVYMDKAAISKDGKYIVVIVDKGGVGRIKIYDFKTAKLLKTITAKDKVYSVAISDDGRYIATGGFDIDIWDLKSGRLIKKLTKSALGVGSIVISSDNRYIAFKGNEKIEIWDIKKYQLKKVIKHDRADFYSLVLSNDDKYLVAGTSKETVMVWSFPDGKLLKTLKGHTYNVYSVALSNDNKYIVSADNGWRSGNKNIRVWDFDTDKTIYTINKKSIESIAISSDNKYIALGYARSHFHDGFIYRWRFYFDEEIENAYALAKQKNTIEAYKDFIKNYSKASQVKEAWKNIYSLAYEKVKQADSMQEYVKFTKQYPNAPQVSDAIEYIYKTMKRQDNLSGYEWFIKNYPKSKYVKEAISKIHKMAYKKAKDIDTISAYNTFIIAYPFASEVKEANKRAKKIERYKYTDTLPSWVRSIMPDFLADILNAIFGVFSDDEKKSRALLIKAKQIERQGNEYYGEKKAGYVIIANRMYDLLQEEYNDTDATLRFLESEEFKDFVKIFKRVMRSMNDRLDNIARYSSEILEVSKQGFSEANADRDMSEYYAEQHRQWQKRMHLMDKGYQ